MFTTGALAWVACRPLLKIIISTFAGFWVAKNGTLSIKPDSALPVIQRLSKVILNIAFPAQVFAKIVPNFDASNIPALGPIILILTIYQLYGFLLAFFIKQVFWVPHRFRYGIYAAAGWGNYGELPIATMLTIMSKAPFQGQKDIDQGIAYISVVVVFFMVTLFPLGGSHLITKDSEGDNVDDEVVQQALRSKQRRWLFFRWCGDAEHNKSASPQAFEEGRLEKTVAFPQVTNNIVDPNEMAIVATLKSIPKDAQGQAQTLHPLQGHGTSPQPSAFHSGVPTLAFPSPAATVVDLPTDMGPTHASSPDPLSCRSYRVSCFSRLTTIISRLRAPPAPPTIAILLACPISVITPLKALFVPLRNANGSPGIPFAPDDAPPLAFILDTATFLGSASVPLALICLGAALAKLKISKGIRGLPLGAISALTIGRLVLQPIMAIAMVEGLVRFGLIDETNKVLRFAMTFIGGMPTSINLIWLTVGDNGKGEVDHVSIFLLPQYILMTFTATALIAYNLHTLS